LRAKFNKTTDTANKTFFETSSFFFFFSFVGVGGLQIKARHGAHVRWVYEGEIFFPFSVNAMIRSSLAYLTKKIHVVFQFDTLLEMHFQNHAYIDIVL